MTKEKVLILHAWGEDSTKAFIPELAKTLKEKGYSPSAINLPNTKSPKFDEWFAFAEKKIEELGKDDLSLVGHSMGGLLALKLAEKYKVNRLVLVAPIGSRPSAKYFEEVSKSINEAELEVYKKFQNRGLNIEEIKKNAKEINFIFGKKDKWINDELRNFYIEKFKDVAKIKVYDNYAHMDEKEGVKKLPEVEELFELKKAEKKKDKKEESIIKKEEAFAKGVNLRISKRQGIYLCNFIKNKKIDEAIKDLEDVKKLKKVVKYKGEIPHRKGKGMMSGRYPVKASGFFISLLKGLKGNVIVNGISVDDARIYYASASWGKRTLRKGNVKAKRTNVILKAREVKN